jgi:beta-1,4-N-acetylglucosaminyltransferase
VILVTVGTAEPFDRLLAAVQRLPMHEPIVAQCGSSAVRPADARCLDYVPFETLLELMRTARAVVTHAGVGSVLTAFSAGKRPIVVPRLASLGEVIDDHQLVFARRLSQAGLVTLADDETTLTEALVARHAPVRQRRAAGGRLTSELRECLRATLGPAVGAP